MTDFDSATQTITFDSTGNAGVGSTYRLVHDFEVKQLNNSRAAADLGFNLNVGTDNRLTGRRVNVSKDPGVGRRFEVGVGDLTNLPDGLIPTNGNAYRVSKDSGTYNFKTAGSGGAGYIAPSTLEASTVDLSSEFTGLITTQRAYSASSKIITTADQMLEELLNIKR